MPNSKLRKELEAKQVAKILRVTRKSCGLRQQYIANELDIDQSAYSRIENGIQSLSAPQWFRFCDITGVLPDAARTGFVEFSNPAQSKEGGYDSGFKLPQSYSNHRGSTVRAMLPFISFYQNKLGDAAYENFLSSLGMDPDFFVNLGNQVNLNFCMDISKSLIKSGVLSDGSVSELTKSISQPKLHGHLRYRYDGIADPFMLIQSIILNAKHYQSNFAYKIEHMGDDFIDISVTPEAHLKAFNYRNDDILGNFLCSYKKSYFQNFCSYGGSHPLELKEIECHYGPKKVSGCLYRIQESY